MAFEMEMAGKAGHLDSVGGLVANLERQFGLLQRAVNEALKAGIDTWLQNQ